MKRAPTLLIWSFFAVGTALTAAAAVAPAHSARVILLAIAATVAIGGIAHARRDGTLGWPATLLASGAVAGLAVARLLPADRPHPTQLAAVLTGFGAYGIVLALAFALLRARGRTGVPAVAADALVIAVSTFLVAWPAITLRIIRLDGTTIATVMHSLHLPVAAAALFVVVAVLMGAERPEPSIVVLGAASTAMVLADLLDDLIAAGHLGTAWQHGSWGLAVGGTVAIGAGLLSFTSPTEPSSNDTFAAGPSPRGRVVVTVGALAFPVIVLGASSADGTPDKVVRTVAAVTLAAFVTWRIARLIRATTQNEAAVIQDALTDTLTGLPNRAVMLQAVENLLAENWGHHQFPTLFFVDLDRFKHINDSLGHAVGDEALVTVAHRLRDFMPANATVARISGDEYVILDPNPTSPAAAITLAEELLNVIREPLALSCGDVFITASIGAASISPTTSMSPQDLVRHADTAMYRAKERGRNCVESYDESMLQKAALRHSLENALHRAVERDELRLHHQPIIDLATGDVSGFEALMRWQQSDGTLVSPAEFIPIAEESGTIIRLGAWALLEALNQLREWVDNGICNPKATMSVNVAARQLREANFTDVVQEALTRSGMSPSSLMLEVTESDMIKETDSALPTLRQLSELGVRLALDDFGTGYSSLSLLQKLPLNRIKIDRSFVSGLAEHGNERSLVYTIIKMADALKLDVVAEGVETAMQWNELKALGCAKAQGYLFSRPVPAEAMRSTVAGLEHIRSLQHLHQEISRTN